LLAALARDLQAGRVLLEAAGLGGQLAVGVVEMEGEKQDAVLVAGDLQDALPGDGVREDRR
jgi:hypothetical protein